MDSLMKWSAQAQGSNPKLGIDMLSNSEQVMEPSTSGTHLWSERKISLPSEGKKNTNRVKEALQFWLWNSRGQEYMHGYKFLFTLIINLIVPKTF